MKKQLLPFLFGAMSVFYGAQSNAQGHSHVYNMSASGQVIKTFDPKQVMITNSGDTNYVVGTYKRTEPPRNFF